MTSHPSSTTSAGSQTPLERFNRALAKYLAPDVIATIDAARAFAEAAASGPEQIRDITDAGLILADMHIDATGVTAGILQHIAIDPVTFTMRPAIAQQITARFGYETTVLIESIAHFSIIEHRKGKRVSKTPRSSDVSAGDRRSREREDVAKKAQHETVRKMFMAMGDDPRIVVFRLAEHLRLMRNRNRPNDEVLALAQEARDIYAPLAGRLGMSRVEAELEDLAFNYLDPDEYRRTNNLVTQVRAEQRDYIDRVCAVLKAEAEKINITAEVSGRYKHLWSIYRKLIRNGWDINQIYDLIAFRVLVPSLADCYAILGQVHALWLPREDRIKDFIAQPKPNGYQSLHTTVFCLDRRRAEIQIRTHDMHKNAEFGVAMHWYYKDVGDTAKLDKRLSSWLQQLRDWQSDLAQRTTSAEYLASTKEEVATRSQVFVFTPHGDVKDLPPGSTPVDFAYRIHTNLGDSCAGARIITTNGDQVTQRLVPLDYVLENGQIVEIISRKDAHPRRGWLTFVRTHAARTHIIRYLKLHERDIYVTVGRDRLERETKAAGFGSIEDIGEDLLRTVAEHFNFETVEELFAAVGGDTLRPSAIIQAITARVETITPAPTVDEKPLPPTPALPSTDAVLNLAGAGGLLARLANCCHPLPGDPIVGYISRGRGIVIHHHLCRGLKRMQEHEGDRLVDVDWQQMLLDRYEAAIIVIARDRTGLLRDVTQQVHEMKLNMGTVTSATSRQGKATISMAVQINTLKQFEEAINRIRTIKDVEEVSRDTRSLQREV